MNVSSAPQFLVIMHLVHSLAITKMEPMTVGTMTPARTVATRDSFRRASFYGRQVRKMVAKP